MRKQPMQEFTPERWEIVKSVLSGEHDSKVSLTAAAKEAGVTASIVRGWIRRSQERRPDDDPLIHEIAPFMEEVEQLQADALEDKLWERAMTGVDHPVIHKGVVTDTYKKVDNRLLMRAIEVRNERYRPRSTHVNVNINDPNDIYERLLAGHRNASAERERQITLEKSQYRVHDEEALPAEFVALPTPVDDPDTQL